jgi:hypothetical protein
MSEATLQQRLAQTLAPLVRDGNVLINDYKAPQVASIERGPWLVIETGDDVAVTMGESRTTPRATYGIYVGLLLYRGGLSDMAHRNAFQALRQSVLATLAAAAWELNIGQVAAAGEVEPWFRDDGEIDSLLQRLVVDIDEYEV